MAQEENAVNTSAVSTGPGSRQPLSPRDILQGAKVTVKVPASSANLGPGYDSMGISLAYYDELTVERLASETLEFDLSGEGTENVPHDSSHLVVQAMHRCWSAVGMQTMPGIRLIAHNRILHSRGMGSSASAIVAGIVAANALLPESAQLSINELFQLCSDMEGHPDNVAPSLFGNLVISWGETSNWEYLSIPVSADVTPVVAIPDYEVSTKMARALIPATVPHAEASQNSARAALLVQALSHAPQYLLAGTQDYLHQNYRAEAMAPSAALVTHLRELGFPAVISGAGPTVMVFARGEDERRGVIAQIERAQQLPTIGEHEGAQLSWRVLPVNIDTEGVIVLGEAPIH